MNQYDEVGDYGENPYETGRDAESNMEELDMDDKTFRYVSHMNKSMLIPQKWPESTSTTLHTKTLFINENINNKQYTASNEISST